MKAVIKNGTKKDGRPAVGQGVQIGTRWSETTVAAIEVWAAQQSDSPGRSEAIRRLVEMGLAGATNGRPKKSAASPKSSELAAVQIDRLTD